MAGRRNTQARYQYRRQKGYGHVYRRQKGYGQRGGGPKWEAFKQKVKKYSPAVKRAIGSSIKKSIGQLMSGGLPKGREGWSRFGKQFLKDAGGNLANEARSQFGFGRHYPRGQIKTVWRV